MPGLRRRRIRPEEVAAIHARFDAVSQQWRPAARAVTGGWTPDQPDGLPEHGTPPPLPSPPAIGPTARSVLVARLGLPSAGAAGLVAVAVLAVVVALAWGWYTRARPVVAAAAPSSAQPSGVPSGFPSLTASGAPGVSPSPTTSVVVDVAGRVRRPGLVTLPAGSRVADALRAAGGARRGTDLTSLNLAAMLVDGQQILVGSASGVPLSSGGTTATSGAPTAAQPLDLNSADVAAFDALPGIGPVLAQRIVDYRTSHGPFHDVSQLQDVSGIGPAKYGDLRPLVRV